jgi:microcompartment protein CcmK/EutM
MFLGRVIGNIVATQKEPKYEGKALLVVQPIAIEGHDDGVAMVAVDSVGAGVGEVVLWASGSSARQTELTKDRPCDAVVMAIVDTWEVAGDEIYRKTPAGAEWSS